jgi:hypothetical protein
MRQARSHGPPAARAPSSVRPQPTPAALCIGADLWTGGASQRPLVPLRTCQSRRIRRIVGGVRRERDG